MGKKKLSTQEILAAARAQDGGGPSAETPAAEEAAAEQPEQDEAAQAPQEEPAEEQPAEEPAAEQPAAEEPKPAKPGASGSKPTSTKDILAAARAQDAGGKSQPGESQKSGGEQAGGEAKKKPSSTKDVLAAARAEAAGKKGQESAKPAASEKGKPAAKTEKKTSPKAPAASKPSGERPSIKEMLEAVREQDTQQAGGKPAAQPEARKPREPKKPAQPAKPAKKDEKQASRRSVLVALVATPFALAWTLFTAATGIFSLALARFMFPNVLVEPPTKFKVGPPSDYPFGSVETKWKDQFGIWVVHTTYEGQNLLYALISTCTHLGCTPNWLQGEQKFKCPCHGSGFYITGVNFEGPAPRPLERAAIRVAPDGMVEVDKSKTYQQELGQWKNPESYVELA